MERRRLRLQRSTGKMSCESGMSLVGAMVSVAVLGLVSIQGAKIFDDSLRSQQHVQDRSEINAISRSLVEGFDCIQTLNLKNISVPPPGKLSCGAYQNLVPKSINGKPIEFGKDWSITGNCINNEVILKVARGPKDPLMKKTWDQTQFGQDIFRGTSDFCRNFFDPNTPYQWKLGGAFTTNIYWNNHPWYCRQPNPITGACSCPLGYESSVIYDFDNRDCINGFYQDLTPPNPTDKKPRGCGILSYVCARL